MSENPSDEINISSLVSAPTFQPCVAIVWGDQRGVITATAAEKRATDLLTAIAIAQAEGSFFKMLAPQIKPKGFGGKFIVNDEEKKAIAVLNFLRSNRLPLPEDINPIFGHRTQRPLIEYRWGERKVVWELDLAATHARRLFEVANVAISDSFFYRFCQTRNIPKEVAEDILEELLIFRRQNLLEDIFEKDNG